MAAKKTQRRKTGTSRKTAKKPAPKRKRAPRASKTTPATRSHADSAGNTTRAGKMALPDRREARLSTATRVDLRDFERRIKVRQLEVDDFDGIVELQLACFPSMLPWLREQVESQIRTFPEGQIGIEIDGRLVASSASLVVDFDEYADWHDWREIADNGSIRNHDPEGDTLYGIEIMVDPEYRGMKLARRLYEARKLLCREMNLQRIMIGGRIPGYHAVADTMSAREYVEKVEKRGLHDPVLTAQLANGFVLKRLIANYLPGDDESKGYATFLEWTNLDHVPDPQRRFQAVRNVRIALVQYQMRRIRDFDEFATQCEFFVDTSADNEADFCVFPELFTLQLLSTIQAKNPADATRELAQLTPRYLDLFGSLAVRYNVNIIGGSQFTLRGEELYNVGYLFRRDGSIEQQDKFHVTPSERRWWGVRPGSGVKVFDTDRGRISILICYDIEFPELARIATAKGARLLFVPFNTENREGYLRVRYCAQARCIENHVYTAITGCCGQLPFVDNADIHYSQSAVFTPSDFSFARDGIAAECTPNIETILFHDVDLELLRRHRRAGSVRNWDDRRDDLYALLHLEDGETRA